MKEVLYAFSVIFIIATLMPLVKKDYWTFRVFDYPRFQKLLLISATLICWTFVDYDQLSKVDFGIIITLVLLCIFLLKQIIPYSPFHTKMVKSANAQEKTTVKVLVGNVYQYNKDYDRCLHLINEENPHLFMLVETDQGWADAMAVLKEEYPYQVELPLENTYGMLLYAKFPLKNTEINYLIDEDIPSIFTDLQMEGQLIKLFAIHPTPPVPGENTHSTERDAEILIVGEKAKSERSPTIIMGDLNDVAWSYTTELFLKISGMGDPRIGRGMYNTFHANYPFLRWPLDHIFLSNQFRLKKIKVHPSIGSDHFPISADLVLDKNNDNEQLEASAEEKAEAKEKIVSGMEF
ncbi:endonuclease/exonuclease/phosphatase family protein [Echinicola soli]|uniref:Endonuclease/exonuclease/phosphatase family protein n=1 Tax=Echinicola soli TaxID=2591634 RepID=A0A514CMJ1_9BACT|nr:endonuclease/exonuclease/phosphatase family protein [Echinicola soli]QDH81010.1 endonuclease/exonuclease/phosphatase family protein [Echinicola soli]